MKNLWTPLSHIEKPQIASGNISEDHFLPSKTLVLCRDSSGLPTAVFGEDVWDFSPYKLSPKKARKLNFSNLISPDGNDKLRRALIDEAKFLMFCVIHFGDSGRAGTLSPRTLNNYYNVLKHAAQFCFSNCKNPYFKSISISQLYSNEYYFKLLNSEYESTSGFQKNTSALFTQLERIGKDIVGFTPIRFPFVTPKYRQHPVIPTKIYFSMIDSFNEELIFLEDHIDNLMDFFRNILEDEYFAVTKREQRRKANWNEHELRPEFDEAARLYNLTNFFQGSYNATDKQQLLFVLNKIQYLCKTIIHLYTGMRDEEVLRLESSCLQITKLGNRNSTGTNNEISTKICLIGTTTKFEGVLRQVNWIATQEVERAVAILIKISSSLIKYYKKPPSSWPLFLTTNPQCMKADQIEVMRASHHLYRSSHWYQKLVITEEDFSELCLSDAERDFSVDSKFKIGNLWPLSSHQFRRSLAYYGAASGLISLPTLKRQLKHVGILMSRYYTNGFENIASLFGYFDRNTQKFKIPTSHFLFEFQTVIPLRQAELIFYDLISNEEPHFGNTGSYIEKVRDRYQSGNLKILESKKDTQNRIRTGEISYSRTLLGGCIKSGACSEFMLGNFTACLTCSESLISERKVDLQISQLNKQIEQYPNESGEYQILKFELGELTKFKTKTIPKSKSKRAK